MKRLIALASLFLIIGCAAPKYNYFPKKINISEPPLNSIVTAYVGDEMLRQGNYSEHDAIFIDRNVKVFGYTLTTGCYLKKGEDTTSEYYLPTGSQDSGQVIENALADPFQAIRLDKKTGKLCAISVYNMESCTNKCSYKKKKYPVSNSESFQQTLLYTGKMGNKINISYREFSNNMARPAFNTDVEYDLSESKTIGYKGARIEIIKATNEYIKYKVLKNFNQANL